MDSCAAPLLGHDNSWSRAAAGSLLSYLGKSPLSRSILASTPTPHAFTRGKVPLSSGISNKPERPGRRNHFSPVSSPCRRLPSAAYVVTRGKHSTTLRVPQEWRSFFAFARRPGRTRAAPGLLVSPEQHRRQAANHCLKYTWYLFPAGRRRLLIAA